MRIADLSGKYRLFNGRLRGPRPGTRWTAQGTVWVVDSLSRPDPDQRVTLIKQFGSGDIIRTMSSAEFWNLVENNELLLVTHIGGVEAAKKAILP